MNNRAYGVKFSGGSNVIVNGISYSFHVKDGIDSEAVARTVILPKSAEEPGVIESNVVESPLPGLILRVYKKPGEKVAVGETVLVIESMKMETPINSNFSGIIQDIGVHQGDQVETGTVLFKVKTIAHGSMKTVARAAEALVKSGTGKALGGSTTVESPLPGLVLRIYKEPGERIRAGESIPGLGIHEDGNPHQQLGRGSHRQYSRSAGRPNRGRPSARHHSTLRS